MLIDDYESLLTDKLNIDDNKEQELLAPLNKAKKEFFEDKLKGLF